MAAGIGMLDRAAGKGELRAAAILGVLKLTGIAGYARDTEGGRELLERAAIAGDAPAARVLGEGFVTGWSGAIDPGRAERYLRLASDRGDVQATFRFGEMLYSGHGVPKNQAEAERLFRKAANTGHAQAQAMLGVLRLMPYSAGLTDNPDEALGWFERAAAQNEPHAMFYLGLFYIEYGKRAGRIDPSRGAEYFRRCAEISLNGQCLFAYATALELGVGIPRDAIKAYALYSLAAMHDNKPKAAKKRDELGKELSPQDLVRANVIASQFLQKKPVSVRVTSKFKAVGTQLNNKNGAPLGAKPKAEP